MIPRLIVWHHLGLGDYIICNGLVHELLNISNEIWLPCKYKNIKTVKHLHSDYKNVKIMEIPSSSYNQEVSMIFEMSRISNVPVLRIGYNGEGNLPFDQQFYEQAGIEFDKRWSSLKFPKDNSEALKVYEDKVKDNIYAVVHNTASVGTYNLLIRTTLPLYYIDNSIDSMLNWRVVVENATEIHCIDSSFIHFADSLKLKAEKLFYHDVGRGSIFTLRYPWQEVKYN